MKYLGIILTFLAVLSFAVQCYLGELIPAWHALIWAIVAFLHELHDYLENRY